MKNLPSILGGKSFKECIKVKFTDLLNQPEIPESKILAFEAEEVILAVCEYYHVSKSELLESRRGVENLQRDMAIYLVRRLCRMTLPYIGREFGIHNYSSVSSVVQRMKSKIESDKRLEKELDKITKRVGKGQKRT